MAVEHGAGLAAGSTEAYAAQGTAMVSRAEASPGRSAPAPFRRRRTGQTVIGLRRSAGRAAGIRVAATALMLRWLMPRIAGAKHGPLFVDGRLESCWREPVAAHVLIMTAAGTVRQRVFCRRRRGGTAGDSARRLGTQVEAADGGRRVVSLGPRRLPLGPELGKAATQKPRLTARDDDRRRRKRDRPRSSRARSSSRPKWSKRAARIRGRRPGRRAAATAS